MAVPQAEIIRNHNTNEKLPCMNRYSSVTSYQTNVSKKKCSNKINFSWVYNAQLVHWRMMGHLYYRCSTETFHPDKVKLDHGNKACNATSTLLLECTA